MTFVSSFKPLYDEIVNTDPAVGAAVSRAIDFEAELGLVVPKVYASTAITSAGYRRDPDLDFPSVIEGNNRVARLVMTALDEHDAPHASSAEVMLPTELGKVPSWRDSHYIIFYFAWLAGLSKAGASWLEQELADPVYAPILEAANDRSKPNAERWPHYKVFTEILLTKLALAEARPGGKRADGSSLLFQLVDVAESLGCRAEEMFADARGLDRLSPTFDAELGGALGDEVKKLRALGAATGAERKPVELVPVSLRA